MTIEELRQEIAQRAGVPANLLTGETVEENIAQARALLAYKRDLEEQEQPEDTAGQFAGWLRANDGIERPDIAGAALDDITKQARMEAGGYPEVEDGGTPYINGRAAPDTRPAAEQFSEWLQEQTAITPFSW